MAYGLLNQEDFWLSREIDGRGVETQSMMLMLAPIDDHNLYSNGHTVAQPVTMSVVEHPRKRPITLPVVRVRVEVSPALLVLDHLLGGGRSFKFLRMLPALPP